MGMKISWNNPAWNQQPDFKCPYCGCGWDEERVNDSEYGYVCPPEGQETYILTCSKKPVGNQFVGCGKSFAVIREVEIKIGYKVKL
jgi:hypothetical protein